MKRLAGALLVLALGAGPAAGATGINFNPLKPLQGVNGLKGLLASGKLDFQNTVGLGFGTGGSGFNQYYLSTTTYQPVDKLTVRATFGVNNKVNGRNVFGQSVSGARLVIPQFGVLYQPTPNLRIQFDFSNVPGYGYGSFWERGSF